MATNPTNQHPSRRSLRRRPFEQFTAFTLTNWRMLVTLISLTLTLTTIWWLVPTGHCQTIGVSYTWSTLLPLVCYSVSLSVGLALMMIENWRSWLSYPFLVASWLFILTKTAHESWTTTALLGLLTATVIILQQRSLGLQNGLGLFLFSGVAGLAFPVTATYHMTHFINSAFLLNLLPVVGSFGYFFTPIMLPNQYGRRLSLLTLGLFWCSLLALPLNAATAVAIVISLIAFAWQLTPARVANCHYVGTLLCQALTLFALYH